MLVSHSCSRYFIYCFGNFVTKIFGKPAKNIKCMFYYEGLGSGEKYRIRPDPNPQTCMTGFFFMRDGCIIRYGTVGT